MNELRSEKGYTLITTAIVIMTISMIIVALTSLFFIYERKQSMMETDNHMTKAREAIEKFISINGYLPCPAPLTATQDSPFYNAQRQSGASCRTASFSNIGTDGLVTVDGTRDAAQKVHIGALPTRTLGIPDQYALDGYDKRIIYAVTASYTDPTTAEFKKANGQIDMKNKAGTSVLNNDGTAIYTIISPGKDRRGAYSIDGVLLDSCDTTSFAGENCDFSDAVFNVSINRNYDKNSESYTNTFYYKAGLDVYKWKLDYINCACMHTYNGNRYFKSQIADLSCVDLNDVPAPNDTYCKAVKPDETPTDCSGHSVVSNCFGWYPSSTSSTSIGACSASCEGSQTVTTTTVTTWNCQLNENTSISPPEGRVACLREADSEPSPNPLVQVSSSSQSCGGACPIIVVPEPEPIPEPIPEPDPCPPGNTSPECVSVSYSWVEQWDLGACSCEGTQIKSNRFTCRGPSGTVSNSLCPGAQPPLQQQTLTCTAPESCYSYSWVRNPQSCASCYECTSYSDYEFGFVNRQTPYTYSCQKSNGQAVSSSFCGASPGIQMYICSAPCCAWQNNSNESGNPDGGANESR